MNSLLALHNRLFNCFSNLMAPLMPLILRVTFFLTLSGYYWQSAKTKVIGPQGGGLMDYFTLELGAFAQIFPKQAEAVNYDASQLGFIYHAIAYAGTAAEYLLPLLIVVGLFTQLAALGMIFFVFVQTFVDITGHGAKSGSLWDNFYGLLDERLIWCVLLLAIMYRGAGAISLDRVLGIGSRTATGGTPGA